MQKEETFIAKVVTGWRFVIYEPIRKSLGLEIGDRVRVTIRIERGENPPGKVAETG